MDGRFQERRLAAIVMADVVGYSQLMDVNETDTLARLRRCREIVVEPAVARHRGRIVKLMGDGILMEFSSAVSAVMAAIEIQQCMLASDEDVADDRQIRLRIGINLGDVIGEGDDIYGAGVNIAARLEPLAETGGICISEKVFLEVRGKIDAEIAEIGMRQLKNISEPIKVYAIAGVVGKAVAPSTSPKSREYTTLAVLPLNNMSGNAEDEYFADGLTEDVITELSRAKHLSVVARNTTFTYKNRSVNVSDIGRQLGADFVLEGSVRQAGRRVRVTVQLIDTETGAHVFAEKFDRDLEDIFAVQDEIEEAVVSRLSFKLIDAATSQREKHPTSNTSAYTVWLRGQAAYRVGDENRARDYWQDAIDIDPRYARALASLGFIYAYWRFSEPNAGLESDRQRRARELAERAIALDRTDTTVLNDVASAFLLLGDHAEAVRFSDMAFAFSPRDSNTLASRAFTLAFCGRHEEGLRLAQRACQFEPHLAPGYISSLGDCFFQSRNFDAALATYRRLIDRPHYFRPNEAACLAYLGRQQEAEAIVKSLPEAFDTIVYARNTAGACALPEDKALWTEGFRMAGARV